MMITTKSILSASNFPSLGIPPASSSFVQDSKSIGVQKRAPSAERLLLNHSVLPSRIDRGGRYEDAGLFVETPTPRKDAPTRIADRAASDCLDIDNPRQRLNVERKKERSLDADSDTGALSTRIQRDSQCWPLTYASLLHCH